MSVSGNISNIARASLHDGPGVRTVVYFKGCGLRCRWCHNPETLAVQKDILYAPIKCIHCSRCVAICPEHHVIHGDDMVFLRENCLRCGRCTEVCPTGALSAVGKEMSVDEVMQEIVKDIHYHRENGGVTLSGGECLLQAEFCSELLRACKKMGIHTAIETSLFVPWTQVEQVLPYCDLVFADLKLADPEKHRKYTGHDNARILENLQKLTSRIPGNVLVRIPMIPGVNTAEEDLRASGHILQKLAKNLKAVELLRYNALARSKYALAGMGYTDFGAAQTDEELLSACEIMRTSLGEDTDVFCVL